MCIGSFIVSHIVLFRVLQQTYPDHPYVADVLAKSQLFDEAAAKFAVSTA
jgi:hypothetical protein